MEDPGDRAGLAGTRAATADRGPATRRAGSHRSTGRRGPIRGFPPPPGQPDPVYPPGQFSPWNRASTRAAWLGIAAPGSAAEADVEPGYAALAISDAAADLTATQTWAVIDDEPPPRPPARVRADPDRGSHGGDTGPRPHIPEARTAAPGRPPGPRSPADPAGARSSGLGERTSGFGPRADGPGEQPSSFGPRRGGPGERDSSFGPRAGGPAERASGPGERPGGPGERTAEEPAGGAGERAGPGGGRTAEGATATAVQAPSAFGETDGGRGARATARGTARGAAGGRTGADGHRGRRGKRHNVMMAGLLLVPVIVVILVVGGYVYLSARHSPAAAPRQPAPTHPQASLSPAPVLGRWKHIENRTLDPAPLTVTELFPAKFTADGAAGALVVTKVGTGTVCPHEVWGSALTKAIGKAGCTQVLRASYLSTDRKIMSTIGVLNLADSTAAEKAGKASGATQFIKQLTSLHGPTRNLRKGTGIEEAEVKGHYLILIWTEFANLHAPSNKNQRAKLVGFSTGLIAGTANVSLTSRMVIGHPVTPAATTGATPKATTSP